MVRFCLIKFVKTLNVMNSEIIFNTDLDSATVYISKIYDADVSEVWDYFTQSELLDQWWAPKPWKCETEKWISEKAEIGFMQWLAQKARRNLQSQTLMK